VVGCGAGDGRWGLDQRNVLVTTTCDSKCGIQRWILNNENECM